MIRSLFATAALAATLAGPGAVRAQEAPPGDQASAAMAHGEDAASAHHVAPAMPAGCGCVSSLADILSMPEGDAFAGFADPAGEEPLWCESPDDPRCAPARPIHQTSLSPSFPTPVSVATDTVAIPPAAFQPWTAPTCTRDGSRPAHAPRLERPPQG